MTPFVGNCNGTPTNYAVIVNPRLTVTLHLTATPNPFCTGSAVTCTATPSNGGSAPLFQWKVNEMITGTNAPGYTFFPADHDTVICSMTSNLTCVTNNPAGSNKIILNGAPSPTVTFSSCFDTLTTLNAKPFKLKGGLPSGGTYTGPGVNPVTGIFTPSSVLDP